VKVFMKMKTPQRMKVCLITKLEVIIQFTLGSYC